jgi:DUF1009 family protein
MTGKEPIGLIAGWGKLPIAFAEKAHSLGIPVVCQGIRGMANREDFEPYCQRFYWTRIGSMGGTIRVFRKEGIKRFTMAGKVHKHLLFSSFRWLTLVPDWRMIRFWYSRSRLSNADDSITLAIIGEFAKDGMTCLSPLELCPELLVRPGVLTKRQPSERELADIAFGWHLAREMGRLDVGQSVAVRDRAVLAVEAIEGTDRAIRRAGELCPTGGFIVVKVAKPNQDMRFDVPTVGPSTIQSIKESGGKVLAIEAAKTILIDEAETIRMADAAGITIVAKEEDTIPSA